MNTNTTSSSNMTSTNTTSSMSDTHIMDISCNDEGRSLSAGDDAYSEKNVSDFENTTEYNVLGRLKSSSESSVTLKRRLQDLEANPSEFKGSSYPHANYKDPSEISNDHQQFLIDTKKQIADLMDENDSLRGKLNLSLTNARRMEKELIKLRTAVYEQKEIEGNGSWGEITQCGITKTELEQMKECFDELCVQNQVLQTRNDELEKSIQEIKTSVKVTISTSMMDKTTQTDTHGVLVLPADNISVKHELLDEANTFIDKSLETVKILITDEEVEFRIPRSEADDEKSREKSVDAREELVELEELKSEILTEVSHDGLLVTHVHSESLTAEYAHEQVHGTHPLVTNDCEDAVFENVISDSDVSDTATSNKIRLSNNCLDDGGSLNLGQKSDPIVAENVSEDAVFENVVNDYDVKNIVTSNKIRLSNNSLDDGGSLNLGEKSDPIVAENVSEDAVFENIVNDYDVKNIVTSNKIRLSNNSLDDGGSLNFGQKSDPIVAENVSEDAVFENVVNDYDVKNIVTSNKIRLSNNSLDDGGSLNLGQKSDPIVAENVSEDAVFENVVNDYDVKNIVTSNKIRLSNNSLDDGGSLNLGQKSDPIVAENVSEDAVFENVINDYDVKNIVTSNKIRLSNNSLDDGGSLNLGQKSDPIVAENICEDAVFENVINDYGVNNTVTSNKIRLSNNSLDDGGSLNFGQKSDPIVAENVSEDAVFENVINDYDVKNIVTSNKIRLSNNSLDDGGSLNFGQKSDPIVAENICEDAVFENVVNDYDVKNIVTSNKIRLSNNSLDDGGSLNFGQKSDPIVAENICEDAVFENVVNDYGVDNTVTSNKIRLSNNSLDDGGSLNFGQKSDPIVAENICEDALFEENVANDHIVTVDKSPDCDIPLKDGGSMNSDKNAVMDRNPIIGDQEGVFKNISVNVLDEESVNLINEDGLETETKTTVHRVNADDSDAAFSSEQVICSEPAEENGAHVSKSTVISQDNISATSILPVHKKFTKSRLVSPNRKKLARAKQKTMSSNPQISDVAEKENDASVPAPKRKTKAGEERACKKVRFMKSGIPARASVSVASKLPTKLGKAHMSGTSRQRPSQRPLEASTPTVPKATASALASATFEPPQIIVAASTINPKRRVPPTQSYPPPSTSPENKRNAGRNDRGNCKQQ